MIGAIIGDTVGSIYEFDNIKTTEFDIFDDDCNYTDDSIMTVAVAEWLLNDPQFTVEKLTETIVWYAYEYPCPMGGYGGRFSDWIVHPETITIEEKQPDGSVKSKLIQKRVPYNSFGNGSAMRTSAVGWMFDSLEETERVAEIQAALTHNHPEGIKGAQATSAAIFMSRMGKSKDEIRRYIEERYGYDLSKNCDEIRPTYTYNESCQGTVPQAITAFLDSEDFESCLRLAVSLGGDSDTLTCIAAGIAEAYYKNIPQWMVNKIWHFIPENFRDVVLRLHEESFYREVGYIPAKGAPLPSDEESHIGIFKRFMLDRDK